MEASGCWPEFVMMRSERRAAGAGGAESTRETVRHFFGDVGALIARQGDSGSGEAEAVQWFWDHRGVGQQGGSVQATQPTPVAEKRKRGRPRKVAPLAPELMTGLGDIVDAGGMIAGMPAAPQPVPMSAFRGKPDVTETENVRWVCDNLRNPGVSPDGCPSLRAWNFLCECRESALFRMNFLKDHYGKLVARKVGNEDSASVAYDGEVQVGLIDKIMAMRDRATKTGSEK